MQAQHFRRGRNAKQDRSEPRKARRNLAKRGAVNPTPAGTTRVTIGLDNEILDWFRNQVDAHGGGNYQTLINEALSEHIARHREPLEAILRRVIREELKHAG